MLWSFARVGYHPGRVLPVVARVMETRGSELNLQSISNTVWALAVLQATSLPLFRQLLTRIHEEGMLESETCLEEQQLQIFQGLLMYQTEVGSVSGLSLSTSSSSSSSSQEENKDQMMMPIPEKLRAAVQEQCKRATREKTTLSAFHLQVSTLLTAMGVEHTNEYLAEDGLFGVDIYVVTPEGRKVAIEVDGPHHFTSNTNQPLGHHVLRRRLMAAMGWDIISVPYFTWMEMDLVTPSSSSSGSGSSSPTRSHPSPSVTTTTALPSASSMRS